MGNFLRNKSIGGNRIERIWQCMIILRYHKQSHCCQQVSIALIGFLFNPTNELESSFKHVDDSFFPFHKETTMLAWWLDNHSAIHQVITKWSGSLLMRLHVLLTILIIKKSITLVWWTKWNVTCYILMIMVGWLMMRPPILFCCIFIFHYFHILMLLL